MSLHIEQGRSLKPYNTLALQARAEFFCEVHSKDELLEALEFARQRDLDVMPLGGGSNIVVGGNISGLVIHINLRGVHPHNETSENIDITFSAGENWHQMVLYSLQQGWYGLENLSLIPGRIGAAPIQNIGAYGAELRDFFVGLYAIDLRTGEEVVMDANDCRFGYRDSVFKHSLRDRRVIANVTLRLRKKPKVNIQYPALYKVLCDEPDVTPQRVSDAVCEIRRSKLPDPEVIPNVGSFFKNPLIFEDHFRRLQKQFPELPGYLPGNDRIRVSAAWLIENCGFKGISRGAVGVHEQQALVLVNYGNGYGHELLELADEITTMVKQRFAIQLEMEPRLYGVHNHGSV